MHTGKVLSFIWEQRMETIFQLTLIWVRQKIKFSIYSSVKTGDDFIEQIVYFKCIHIGVRKINK